MSKVNILPPEIVSKIAAGEVVERPASVVKELLENCLDAGADNISLHIKEGGKTLIHLKDNGYGIEQDDIENIFLRHSTSKISTIDDLYSIDSLGFRGEALYSIAAVSDVTLRSKTAGQDVGWEINLRGLKKISLKPVNMQTGTEIIIKELFFNTPARKKFLKRDTTELKQILSVFQPYTLLFPQKAFNLKHNNKNIIQLKKDNDIKSRITKALNIESKFLLTQKRELPEENLKAELILGDMNIRRPRKDLQFVFVNDRPVLITNLSYALAQVYRNILPPGVHPFFYIKLYVPAKDIDVNIHPTKREIKIKNDRNVVSAIASWSKQLLLEDSSAREMTVIKTSDDSISEAVISPYQKSSSFKTYAKVKTDDNDSNNSFEKAKELGFDFLTNRESTAFETPITLSLRQKLEHAQYIGSFIKKYLLFETMSSLLYIDQHAAHERINYEKLCKAFENKNIEIQQLLVPAIIALTAQEKINLEENEETINSMGFSINMWDNDNLAIHAHPTIIKNPETAVRNMISGAALSFKSKDEIARMACRSSVMTGDQLQREEAINLIKQLLKCNDPFTCPHGRPTVIEIEEKVIAKHFLR